MKRNEVLAILENAELDNSAKLQQILDLNGASITARDQRIKALEEAAAGHSATLDAEREKYKDYDAILQERDKLKAEKEEKEFEGRFLQAMGKNKPKNDFTKKGLIDLFRSETQKAENQGKQDADIFAAMVKGKEAEYFDSPVRLSMTPTNPAIQTPTSTEAYLDAMYEKNPYYKKNN
jgi:flagellar basal body rod protein FlgC